MTRLIMLCMVCRAWMWRRSGVTWSRPSTQPASDRLCHLSSSSSSSRNLLTLHILLMLPLMSPEGICFDRLGSSCRNLATMATLHILLMLPLVSFEGKGQAKNLRHPHKLPAPARGTRTLFVPSLLEQADRNWKVSAENALCSKVSLPLFSAS